MSKSAVNKRRRCCNGRHPRAVLEAAAGLALGQRRADEVGHAADQDV